MPDPLFFQMDPEEDFFSKLMGHGGGRSFFASCLLCLNPEQLKACRLVNSAWAKFILDEVWKTSKGRKRLEEKLVERWKTADPMAVELAQMRETVYRLSCNDAYAFCGLDSGKVAVYRLTTGQWVRDLMGTGLGCLTRVSCSKTLVVAAQSSATVTVWSSKGKMEQLYSFNATNHTCQDVTCQHGDRRGIEDLKVVGSKIALLVVDGSGTATRSLVVIRKGENIWEDWTLACFGDSGIFLAADKDWLSITKSRLSSKRTTLWQDDTFRKDIDLPGCVKSCLLATAMDLPFFILCLRINRHTYIKVFRLAADMKMENISTEASLIKSMSIGGVEPLRKEIICNQLFFGVIFDLDEGVAVTLIEKKTLGDADVTEPERRSFNLALATKLMGCVDMNSTSLIFARNQKRDQKLVLKHDFWIANIRQTCEALSFQNGRLRWLVGSVTHLP